VNDCKTNNSEKPDTMKQKILFLSLIIFSFFLSFTACKKESSPSNIVDNSTEAAVQSGDQLNFSSETDAVANDADIALETTSYFSGRVDQTQSLICDASITLDTMSNPRKITITYNGTNCFGNRTRTGAIVIYMAAGVRWKNAGASIAIAFQNLKITRASDNKSITINGVHTITNVSGGLLINLATLGTITHTITSSGMTVKFDDGTQRAWQVAKQRVFSYNNGGIITTTGTHTEGSNTNISEWGSNRFGHTFSSAIVEPLVVRQDCNFRIVSGKIRHTAPAILATATFGLDVNGAPTPCPGSGHYYLKVEWTGLNGSHSAMLPY
jgi:hypothetical protein